MKNVISLAEKAKADGDGLIEKLTAIIEEVKSGEVKALSFAMLRRNKSLLVGSEVVTEVSTLEMLGTIRALEQWYMDEHLRGILTED